MSHLFSSDGAARSRLTALNAEVERLGRKEIDLATLHAAVVTALPGDVVHAFLTGMN
jgi:putative ATP-dependent endonuclease of OLD family